MLWTPLHILLPSLALASAASAQSNGTVAVNTTSGSVIGLESDGIQIFKGVRYAEPPVEDLRWEPPQPFINSTNVQNATTFGASCIPQYDSAIEAEFLNAGAPPAISEDCLFLNIWAPLTDSTNTTLRPVVVWIYGGAFEFGTSALPEYDGASMAKNQDIVVVSFNYRTNIFGFPISKDIPSESTNVGLLDQELAFQWVQDNIAQFGGNKSEVTIMGQSAGARSVSAALIRHNSASAPFRAGIMFSGAFTYRVPTANFTPWEQFAIAVNCTQDPGAERLACLKAVPATLIQNLTNSDPSDFSFETPLVDNFTVFEQSLQHIQSGNFSKKPILIGNMEDDGSIWAFQFGTSIRAMLLSYLGSSFAANVTDDQVRALYPGQNDSQVISEFIRDHDYRCPASLWAKALVENGVPNVLRYSYGAVFQDLQVVPGLGAFHGSELFEVFGTFNASSATAAEKTLASTFQTAIANFIKYPIASPAANWTHYNPSNSSRTLAKIAYNGNVDPNNFVQPVAPDTLDGPCELLINDFLTYTLA